MKSKLQLLEINDDHWMYDYEAGLTIEEKIERLADRLEAADIDLAMIYYVAINTAFAGQPESIYVRAVLREPAADCTNETLDIGNALLAH